MMGHTPAPWEACDPGDYSDFDGNSRVILGDDRRIAVVHWHPSINTEESEANARLIAAAPELLTQLEYAVKLLGAFPMINATAQVQSMRDTIAKATGADQ